jgi:hypothetical protein
MASNKSKTNGSAQAEPTVPATDANDTDIIPFDDAVRECKELALNIKAADEAAEQNWYQITKTADNIEPLYGDRTQAKFAKAIGVEPCTLKRRLTVYRTYKGIGAPGPQSSYAVLRELAKHPDAAKIIQDNPNMTKREALDLMRKQGYDEKEKAEAAQEDDWLKAQQKMVQGPCRTCQ